MTWRTARRYSRIQSDLTYHPPGPGIGVCPGHVPALGRPGLLPDNHGAWKNDGCYSRMSKGWKPDIMSIGTAHSCPGEKGPQSPFRPINTSGDPSGYNSHLFHNENDVARVLKNIGYKPHSGDLMLRRFQADWNLVASRIDQILHGHAGIRISHIPNGILQVDGRIGPNTLNALEVSAIIQGAGSSIQWIDLVRITSSPGIGYGRKRIYNAAQRVP